MSGFRPLFTATAEATEETIVGVDNHTVIALPDDTLQQVLKKYNR